MNYIPTKVAAGQVESQGETFASFLFDIIRYHVTWRELDKSYFPKASGDLPYNCSKGYYGTDLCEVLELSDNSAVTSTLAIHPDAQADLESVLDHLTQTGAQALFVNAPSGESVEEKQKYNYIARLVGERATALWTSTTLSTTWESMPVRISTTGTI